MIRLFDGDPARVATILPDADYTPDRALLHFTRRTLTELGWSVREVWWEAGARVTEGQVRAEAVAAMDAPVADGPCLRLVIGMGVGSLAVPAAVERSMPGVWLAPLLRHEAVIAGVASVLEPSLLVGGTNDPHWDAEVAQASRCQEHEVKDADHALEVPDSVRASVRALDRTLRRVEDFIRGLDH